MTAGAGRFASAVFAVAAFGLSVPSRAAAPADCSSHGSQTVKVIAVEPRLELRLADGRVLRLVGVDPAAPTPDDSGLEETARARLASLIEGRDVSVRILESKQDRWGRLPVLAFLDDAAGGIDNIGGVASTAIAAGLARYKPEPAAHACRDAFIAAETKARTAAVGLWRDSFYAVLAVDGRSAFDKRSATVVLAEGRLTAVDAGPYRTKLRFAARDRTDRDVLATILPRTMKLFETQGVTFSSLIGRTLRFRGLLDLRFGPEIELIGPDAVEILPAESVPSTPEAAGHG